MISRRLFLKKAGVCAGLLSVQSFSHGQTNRRPNILLAISDDQSWPHAGAYGCEFVSTPAFDRIAKEGVLFSNAFTASPQCSPNRAAILTGRHIGSIREAGTHDSLFPRDLTVYTELLEKSGYRVGYTGKGWSPGNWRGAGWSHNPVGKEYSEIRTVPPAEGISHIDYAANFEQFLAGRKDGQPFCFWFGSNEPHRGYQQGAGVTKGGKTAETVTVPGYLPDTNAVRRDFLDYAYEIEWFDKHLMRMLETLEQAGELDNTLIVVTADNGMPFPRAKATLYEDGIHVPLAVRFPAGGRSGAAVDRIVSHIDLAPTFLEIAGLEIPQQMQGTSLTDLLTAGNNASSGRKSFAIAGRERHTSARPDNAGYPSRAIRTESFLYIHNFKPDRWPLGDNQDDVDNSPSKSDVLKGRHDESLRRYFDLSFAKKPEHELYDIRSDRECLKNLAYQPGYEKTRDRLWSMLQSVLEDEKDPRAVGGGDIFESYPRFSKIRPVAGPDVKQGKYVKKYMQPGQVVPPELMP